LVFRSLFTWIKLLSSMTTVVVEEEGGFTDIMMVFFSLYSVLRVVRRVLYLNEE
jgi:hypothetical protein